MFFRTLYNYDVDKASRETAIAFDPEKLPSLTQQEFAKECDINEIVRRFGLTGELPESVNVPRSGDFTGITDYKSAMDAIAKANSDFMELPAHIRAQFDNDPQKLLVFMEDGKNLEKARELGLVNPPAEVTRDAVRAIDDLAARLAPPAQGADSAKSA